MVEDDDCPGWGASQIANNNHSVQFIPNLQLKILNATEIQVSLLRGLLVISKLILYDRKLLSTRKQKREREIKREREREKGGRYIKPRF